MKLTHLSPVQYWFIQSYAQVYIHKELGETSLWLSGKLKELGKKNRGGKLKWDGWGKVLREICKLNYKIFCTNAKLWSKGYKAYLTNKLIIFDWPREGHLVLIKIIKLFWPIINLSKLLDIKAYLRWNSNFKTYVSRINLDWLQIFTLIKHSLLLIKVVLSKVGHLAHVH